MEDGADLDDLLDADAYAEQVGRLSGPGRAGAPARQTAH